MHPAIHKVRPMPVKNYDLIHKLEAYSELSYMKRCIFAVFIRYIDSDKLIEQRRAFYEIDKNLNGIIGIIEICDFFEDLKTEVSQQEISTILSKIGIKSRAKLCFSEFASVFLKVSDFLNSENRRLTFEFFDRQRKGFFDAKNYLEAVDLLGGRICIEECEAQLTEISKTGVIMFEDFKSLLQ